MTILTCKEFKVDCISQNQVVPANPDIAGIGVIISFITTTCFAFVLAFVVMFLERYNSIRAFSRKHIQKLPAKDYSREHYNWRTHMFWFRILSKNLLAFSDTQLVTGLAVQFTAILKHCELSVYHFVIVVELAFLTTVTHLLTLVALRNFFVANPWVNLPRIFFMMGNLGLLGYTSYIAYSYNIAGLHASSPLACFYQGHRPPFKAAFAGRWGVLLVGAIGGHLSIVIAMYFLEHKQGKILKGWAFIRNWFLAPLYAIYGIAYGGIALHKTQALGVASVNIRGSEKEWGFGQFLPVLLLALPLFAGWESFWEEHDESERGVKHFSLAATPSRHARDGSHGEEMATFMPKHNPAPHHSADYSSLEAQTHSDSRTPSPERPSPRHSPGLSPRPNFSRPRFSSTSSISPGQSPRPGQTLRFGTSPAHTPGFTDTPHPSPWVPQGPST